MKIDEITIPDRVRKDMGDLEELMESIRTKGLINAITVTEDKILIAGERRIRACQLLGMEEVKVDVIDVKDLEQALLLEIDENECRKDFSKAERVDYMKQLFRIESAKSEQRMKAGFKDPMKNSSQGKTRDIVANRYGISHDTMKKEMAIADNKHLLTPEDFADWDEGRLSTNKAYQKLKEKMEEGESKAKATEKKLSDAQARLKKLEAEKEDLQKRIAEMEEDTCPVDEEPEKVTSPVEGFYNSTVEYTGNFVTYMLSREGFMAMDSKDQEMFKDAVARLDNLCKRMKGYIV